MMKVALDVAYQNEIAVVGIVQFADWDSAEPAETRSLVCKNPSEYIPGMFYLRELPCLLKGLTTIEWDYDYVVIDGYVHLAGPRMKGLGCHLYEALGGKVVVIGVAKSPLKIARDYLPILRGVSKKPLMVSAMGIDMMAASTIVANMHGRYRIPTIIKYADSLSRGMVVDSGGKK